TTARRAVKRRLCSAKSTIPQKIRSDAVTMRPDQGARMTADAIQYDFLSPQRIVFGWGRRREVGGLVRSLGRRVVVIAGSRTLEATGTIGEIIDLLKKEKLQVELVDGISHEPDTPDVDRTVPRLRDLHADAGDVVLAVGGGSAIDLGKAAA